MFPQRSFYIVFKQVKSARRITIIGAGAVGVEIAAEIATDYPDKEVTVVSASTQIVTGPFKDSFRDGAMKQLKELGVNFILGKKNMVSLCLKVILVSVCQL